MLLLIFEYIMNVILSQNIRRILNDLAREQSLICLIHRLMKCINVFLLLIYWHDISNSCDSNDLTLKFSMMILLTMSYKNLIRETLYRILAQKIMRSHFLQELRFDQSSELFFFITCSWSNRSQYVFEIQNLVLSRLYYIHELHCDRRRIYSASHDHLIDFFYSSSAVERKRSRLNDIFSIYVEFSSLRIDSKTEMFEQIADSFAWQNLCW
jgi:hypothetical protein